MVVCLEYFERFSLEESTSLIDDEPGDKIESLLDSLVDVETNEP